MPNLIPDWLPWMRPAGRLIWSVILFVIGLIVVLVLMRRAKPDRPSTWSECMAGAVGVFGLMALGYGVIPHEWITFSDKYLQWDTTKFLFRSHQDVLGLGVVNWPFNFDMHNIRDIIVTLIYGIVLVLSTTTSALCPRRRECARQALASGAGLPRRYPWP
jgi:hypothetical protein